MVMTVLYGFIPFLYLPALSLGLNAAIIGNAMPTEGVEKLVDFMEKFRKANA